MQTTYLEECLRYERAVSECYSLLAHLNKRRTAAEETARRNGWEMPDYFDKIVERVREMQKEFSDLASCNWKLHEETEVKEYDEDGMNNLVIAVAKSWADDYEIALSHRNEKQIKELHDEGIKILGEIVVERVERAHRAFVKSAREDLKAIIADTNKAPKYNNRTDHVGSHMQTRCPLCGGGMYSRRVGANGYLIRCSGCSLSEMVEVRS